MKFKKTFFEIMEVGYLRHPWDCYPKATFFFGKLFICSISPRVEHIKFEAFRSKSNQLGLIS
jgi:hypothetical protein